MRFKGSTLFVSWAQMPDVLRSEAGGVSGRDFTDDELATAMLASLFLLERAKELERVALDQGRSREVREVAALYAGAIRKELR
jgi:hypothetical protein